MSSHSSKSLRSRPQTVDSKKRYPEIKQRGYYSDIAGEDARKQLGDVLTGPELNQDILYDVATELYTPYASAFSQSSESDKINLSLDVHGPSSCITTVSDFPPDSFQPKVQLPFFTRPGQCPRKIEMERRKRAYSKFNLEEQLACLGIHTALLMPKLPALNSDISVQLNCDPNEPAPFPPYLCLDTFDNTEYETRQPEEWLELGWVTAEGVRKPVPGRALLPTRDDFEHLDPRDSSLDYKWFDIGMLDYDITTKLYFVQKVNKNGRIVDYNGHTIVNGGLLNDGSRLSMSGQYWVPRIRLMFCAEDPRLFAERVAYAFTYRRQTEALLRYSLYIDCMPMEGVGELDQASLKRMTDWAKGAPQLAKDHELDDYIQMLEKEVNIDFCWSMNRIIFDKTASEDPETFAFVTIPEPIIDKVPAQGCFNVIPMTEVVQDSYEVFKYDMFAKLSLLTKVEVIQAIVKVRAECNKVTAMSLYHIPTTKHMRLEEFEQAQASSQVALFLKDSWISTLRAAIRTSLRDVGRGWFNLHEANWEVYQISKLKKFMEMIKFNMQDSLRYLVQDSLVSFSQLIVDACHSTLQCENNMTWPSDVINSSFKPRRNPLFLLDLVMDTQGVHYSSALSNFETVVVSLFDKGISSCQNVPQLEKFIMEDIFFSGTPLLEAVGMHEPFVEELRETVRNAIAKSLIPMKAYVWQYESFLTVMNLDINSYIKELEGKKPSAAEIKAEVEMHLNNKDIVEAILPSSIVIGPFYVNTEGVRQGLSKKKKVPTATLR